MVNMLNESPVFEYSDLNHVGGSLQSKLPQTMFMLHDSPVLFTLVGNHLELKLRILA